MLRLAPEGYYRFVHAPGATYGALKPMQPISGWMSPL
jgi:hypothetical protein